MLTTLRIRNLALVADLTLELQPGYNAITGETGAGKSILIGALNLVLGGRAERTLLRAGADSCTVEAVFDTRPVRPRLRPLLEAHGLEPGDDDQLVLKRTFTAAGANRQFVNGSPVTLHVLAALGDWLVDIHGPHEHQSLLHPARQLLILDAFGDLDAAREQFAALVRRRAELQNAKADLIVDERAHAQQLDLLRFQIHEITAAGLQADEEARLAQDHQRASNAAKLLQLAQAALAALEGDDLALLARAAAVGRPLRELARLDPAAASLAEQHDQAVALWQDLHRALARYADAIDVDPEHLQTLEDRLNLLNTLKRKYGSSVADVIAFGQDAQRKLHQLEHREAELARLHAELAALDVQIQRAGEALSARRAQLIPRLRQAVDRQLQDLGFQHCRFDVSLTRAEAGPATPPSYSPTGFDRVEFEFAPNVGEPMKPLRAIASSGELARVMLALKTVLAAQDDVPVLIFDEVDANVGGQTAHAIAEKMRQLGRRQQVLCITHLAPVAAAASAHYLVTKQVQSGRARTDIVALDHAGRVAELARMLGGPAPTARQHAETLLHHRQPPLNASLAPRPHRPSRRKAIA